MNFFNDFYTLNQSFFKFAYTQCIRLNLFEKAKNCEKRADLPLFPTVIQRQNLDIKFYYEMSRVFFHFEQHNQIYLFIIGRLQNVSYDEFLEKVNIHIYKKLHYCNKNYIAYAFNKNRFNLVINENIPDYSFNYLFGCKDYNYFFLDRYAHMSSSIHKHIGYNKETAFNSTLFVEYLFLKEQQDSTESLLYLSALNAFSDINTYLSFLNNKEAVTSFINEHELLHDITLNYAVNNAINPFLTITF